MITKIEDCHPHPAVGGFSKLELTVDGEEHVVYGSFEAVVALKALLMERMFNEHPVEALRDLAVQEAERLGLDVDHESFDRVKERLDAEVDACGGDPYRRPRR